MNQRLGKFLIQKGSGEEYKAYIPPMLPPMPPIDLERLYPYLEKSNVALAELNSRHKTIPNKSLFICMYVKKLYSQVK